MVKMMIQLIIGNLVALISSILMVYSGAIKQKKKILYIQTIQLGFAVVSNLILSGITGAIINSISCVRNILCYKDKLGFKEKLLITFLSTIFSVAFNNLGVIGILPLISLILYLWLMNVESVIKFKLLIIFSTLFWLIYDITIKSYSSAIFDFMTITANIISIIQLNYLNERQ